MPKGFCQLPRWHVATVQQPKTRSQLDGTKNIATAHSLTFQQVLYCMYTYMIVMHTMKSSLIRDAWWYKHVPCVARVQKYGDLGLACFTTLKWIITHTETGRPHPNNLRDPEHLTYPQCIYGISIQRRNYTPNTASAQSSWSRARASPGGPSWQVNHPPAQWAANTCPVLTQTVPLHDKDHHT